jgi:glycerol kinase
MQADLLNVRVERPKILESTAQGAAYMAGLAVGYWKSVKDLESHREVERIFEPDMDDETRQAHLKQWRRAVERALHWIED